MTDSRIAILKDRALVRIGGDDARHFLHNLVTCDIEHLQPGEAAFGALLSPQGKIQFDFFIIASTQGYLLDVAAPMRDDLMRRLDLYRLRSKVTIEAGDPRTGIHASWGGEPPLVDGVTVADPRLPEMGHRLYCRRPPTGEAGDYAAHRIALGMPEGGTDFAFGAVFPHEALMDQNNGVSFTKGCFVGQEVVSRMQHRGTARNRFVRITAAHRLPPPNTDIIADGRVVGHTASSVDTAGLALVRLDKIAEALARGTMITAGSTGIRIALPQWVQFGLPPVDEQAKEQAEKRG